VTPLILYAYKSHTPSSTYLQTI